ncbi:Kae1-associated serine/threonine protein kinase [Candidatus Marsarchaeota archaeon]|nr:Kae1-associated serine/threonine protein kinase [Candidatus Marsarchaeota archaeon]
MQKYRKVNEGAEAVIYASSFLGIDAIIKHRAVKDYREESLDKMLRYQRTKKEAKILSVASEVVNAPKVLFLEKDRIFMQRIRGENLSAILQTSAANGAGKANLQANENLFAKIGVALAALHGIGIVHGDFTPANILVDKNSISIIDFGLADMSQMIEDKAVDMLLMKRAISNEQYAAFLAAYKKGYNKAPEIIKRLEKIERRGRYQERTLTSTNEK